MDLKRFQEALRQIYCFHADNFKAAFGEEMGGHLWSKYRSFDSDPAKLICSLDYQNLQLLSDYLVKAGI